ncbi:gluconate kinase, SKI family [Cohaesibacter marisflavi]|uniref:Gluconokinase n=1 Tax=Cohaesibacter marisflavi TaxID=655353 RepID=A0A1I5M5V2_9HYPH|nr:gluconokinase [Cohaesibacter marisflavi]SFP04306.1 gluconate kinase, SKI family [Cohaesibacter marisflavi]
MLTAASQSQSSSLPVIIVMGVCGCGKSSVGEALAEKHGLPFLDADDYHPKANVDKMSKSVALQDEDRWPWFEILSKAINEKSTDTGSSVCGCSALKRSYRRYLSEHIDRPVLYVHLHGSKELLFERLSARKDHYMPPSLLESQLAILEQPQSDENAIVVSIDQSIANIVSQIETYLTTRS